MTTLTTKLLDDIVAAFNEHDAEKVVSFFHMEGELKARAVAMAEALSRRAETP